MAAGKVSTAVGAKLLKSAVVDELYDQDFDAERAELRDLFQQSPSLHRALAESVAGVYRDAVRRATLEAGLPAGAFPARCPYTPAQILDHDFLPGGAAVPPPAGLRR